MPIAADNISYGGGSTQPDMGMADILQLCCLGRRTGQIMFRSQQSVGYVFVQNGQVLHASCGTLQGEAAIYAMLAWIPGSFTFADDVLPQYRTITLSWEQLLFEGATRADQGLIPVQTATMTELPAEMATASSSQEKPKLSVLFPPGEVVSYDLDNDFTYAGRLEGSDIFIPDPSVSSRHAVFVRSGPDIIVRDLNSSNGTTVNGIPISEQILRLGDEIHLGSVEIRYELVFRRPKLRATENSTPPPITTPTAMSLPTTASGELKTQLSASPLAAETLKLPNLPDRPKLSVTSSGQVTPPAMGKSSTDQNFVSGSRALSYAAIAPAEPKKKKSSLGLILLILVLILLLTGGGAYYFLVLRPH